MRIHHIHKVLADDDDGVLFEAVTRIVRNLRSLGIANDVRELSRNRDRISYELDIPSDVMDAIIDLPRVQMAIHGHARVAEYFQENERLHRNVSALQRSAKLQAAINILIILFIASSAVYTGATGHATVKLVRGLHEEASRVLCQVKIATQMLLDYGYTTIMRRS